MHKSTIPNHEKSRFADKIFVKNKDKSLEWAELRVFKMNKGGGAWNSIYMIKYSYRPYSLNILIFLNKIYSFKNFVINNMQSYKPAKS